MTPTQIKDYVAKAFPQLKQEPRSNGWAFFASGEKHVRIFRALERRGASHLKLAVSERLNPARSNTFVFRGTEQELHGLIAGEIAAMGALAADAPLSQFPQLPTFETGRVYERRPELNGRFGGNSQSGISDSSRSPVIFLFTGDSGERFGYRDHFDEDGTFFFTGEGQRGDMVFARGNLALRDHSSTGKAVHLFRTIGKGKGQKYLGEFVYQDHEWVDAQDLDGRSRKAIIFRLVPVARLERDELTSGIGKPKNLSLDDARSRAIAASKTDGSQDSRQAIRNIYERSQAVRDYVLLRAAGVCELCDHTAPFLRAGGTPYLEPHHVTRLSDGGPDHPHFVAALCPSCHREVHYGEHAAAKNQLLRDRLVMLEPVI